MASLLVLAQWRTRRRRHIALAAAFGAGILCFLLLAIALAGVQKSVTDPIAATSTGDLRITQETGEVAGGTLWPDVRNVEADLARATGGQVSIRLESTQVVGRVDDESWSGGILLGIEPHDRAERERIGPLLVWGEALPDDLVFGPDGTSYVPLVIGERAAAGLHLNLSEDGKPAFDQPVLLTSGRSRPGSADLRPINHEAVVVGVFDTGLQALDRFTAYVPLQSARTLLGYSATEPVANALLLEGDAAAGQQWAASHGYVAETPHEFGGAYLGTVLLLLDALAVAAITLMGAALLLWLVQETAAALRADGHALASLDAIGIAPGRIRNAYAGLAGLSVLAGAVAAGCIALVLRMAPPWRIRTDGFHVDIPMTTPTWALWGVVVAPLAAWGLAWWATWRFQQRGLVARLKA